jgi:CIC family chloride channel protein
MILPLMVAAVSASYLAQSLYPESIYTMKLTRRGIRFDQGRDLDIMQSVQVEEVMNRAPITMYRTDSLAELYQKFQETNYLGFPVLNSDNSLYGIVTLQDLENTLARDSMNLRNLQVEDVAVIDAITVFSDEAIWTAIQKMAPRDLARLPVVSRDGKGDLLGLISRSDILRAYDIGIIRKQRGQLLDNRSTLRNTTQNDFMELRLTNKTTILGQPLKNIALSRSVNVVSVERNGELLIPRGDTVFESGDIITFFGRSDCLQETKQVFI